MKKACCTAVNILFFLFIAVVGVLFYTLPDKPTVSEREKRELAKCPEMTLAGLLDGSYTADYSVYFADNFPFREQLIAISQRIDEYTMATDDGAKIIIVQDNDSGAVEDLGEETPPEVIVPPVTSGSDTVTDPVIDEPEQDPDAAFDDAEQINQSLYVAGDTVLTIAYQTKRVQREYVAAVNDFAKEYPDLQVHCGVIPIASAFYLPDKYRTEATDQKMMIDYIYERLDERVKTVDIYSALARQADEYIYFRTDHHWTGLGAYYAYKEFIENNIGGTPMDITGMNTVVYDNYLGTLYDKVGGGEEMRNNPDTVIAYDIDSVYPCDVEYWVERDGSHQTGPLIIKDLKNDNKYMVFTNGDWRFVKITTGQTTGRKIMIFKDSFANAFIPFLVTNFDEIYVADPRYALPSLKSIIQKNDVTDVLFLTNVTNTSVEQRASEYRRLFYI